MMVLSKRIGAAALLLLGALGTAGCEVDRSPIPETGGGGQGGSVATGGSGGSAPMAVCPDGLVQGDEQCDDGNHSPGDGCSADCKVEYGFVCEGGQISFCHTVCGDGLLAGEEECDDGNTTSDDGCDPACLVEMGWLCSGEPAACVPGCGDGLLVGDEACDDGNITSGDGCDAGCAIEDGFTCSGEPSACAGICGDGLVLGAEQCDDANTANGDGCSALCAVEPGFTCSGAPSVCPAICGDGIVAAQEACDDGGKADGDGCSALCTIESGWLCSGAPSLCATDCGDGIVAGAEECDDANTTSFDGCDAACRVDVFTEQEPNDVIAGANGPYDHTILYRGAIAPASDADLIAVDLAATTDLRIETFDPSGQGSCANIDTVVTLLGTDGTTVIASDDDAGINACSSLDPKLIPALRHLPAGIYFVKVEAYAQYQPIPGYSVVISFDAVCGDGVKQGFEECDGTPGCNATCDRVPACGDGFVDGAEQCDDGNLTSGDGCSATCQYEVIAEAEPNGTAATAGGPRAPNVLFGGSVSPAADADYFAITLPVTADLRLETFDASGPSSCAAIDTVITLIGTDGTTTLISRDQGGVNNCSRIDPVLTTDAAARHLPAGTYFVKVESFLNNAVIPGYTLLATYAARCGDGIVEGAETCDGGAGCTATCDRIPVCGDGFVDGAEQCDDGNTASGDGCSATCQIELLAEMEPNDTGAQANGPYASHALIAGSINPATDLDWFAVQIGAVSDLKIETFDGNGPGSCVNVDTVATLYAPDGTTVLATQDDGGIGKCSRIDPKIDLGARHLSPGTYYVKIEDFLGASVIPAYRVEVSFVAVCGDGIVEGAEECDGTPGCDAGCNRVPVCGDGFVDAPETCDDGNATSGDGCSATCQLESIAEVEPNGTPLEADTAPIVVNGSATIAGAIGAIGDKDVYRLSLAQAAVIRFETLDGTGAGCAIATTLRLFDAAGAQLYSDDNSGMSSCSALVLPLAAGTYYAGVEQQGNTAAIPAYLLAVRVQAGAGAEAEPNDTRAQASMLNGSDVFVSGVHQVGTDTDYYAITVPAGRSIRAEIIEGSAAETCESLDIDSLLTLYDAGGVAIEMDDDGGRGFCSRLDGTGVVPASPGASKLPGGTYYLAVEAAPFAQSPTDSSGQFDYRLVLTTR